MAEATLDISEWERFVAELSARNAKASDYLKLAVETKGREDVVRHFERESGPGGRWKARSPATDHAYAMIASGRWQVPRGGHRSKYDPNNLLLQLSGRLKGSVQPGSRKDGGVRVLSRDAVLLYSAVEYSRAHDQGIPGRLPQREFMWLSDEGRAKVADVFLGALMEGL